MKKARSKVGRKAKRRRTKTLPHGEVRLTTQRKAVLRALTENCGHPTVRELFEQTRKLVPNISLATIYNSLQALQEAGLVNHHRLSSGGARFCINKEPHVHMLDESTGRMMDVKLKAGVRLEDVFELPAGVSITSMRAYLHGRMPS